MMLADNFAITLGDFENLAPLTIWLEFWGADALPRPHFSSTV